MFYAKNQNSYEDFIYSRQLWLESVCRNPLYLGEPDHRYEDYNFRTVVVVEKHKCVIGLQIKEPNMHELYAIIKCSFRDSKTNIECYTYYIRYVEIQPEEKSFGIYPDDCQWIHEDVAVSDEEIHKVEKLIKAFSSIEAIEQQPFKKSCDLTQNCIVEFIRTRYNDGLADYLLEWEDVPVVTPTYVKVCKAAHKVITLYKHFTM